MNVVTQTLTADAAGSPIILDYLPTSQITAAVTSVGAGTGTALAVQVTLDNVFDPDASDYVAPASARWFTVTGAPVDETAGYVTFDGPWRAIRCNVTTADGNTIIFQVGQSTTPRA